MDQIKIGKYIAEKRKSLGLTQVQLAEKLGMSDKSVSKWERGVCLPDVSVYIELCHILNITLNEFIAGEDLDEAHLAAKAEENLIQVTVDGICQRKRLRLMVSSLVAVTLLVAGLLVYVLYSQGFFARNYIRPLAENSTEMKIAGILSGVDGAHLYEYSLEPAYRELSVSLTVYEKGRKVKEEPVLTCSAGEDGSNGVLAIIPDFETFTAQVILADETSKYETAVPFLDNASGREYYGRTFSSISERRHVQKGASLGILALIYDGDSMNAVSIETIEQGASDLLSENDYVYYFSLEVH